MERKIYIHSNGTEVSEKTAAILAEKLESAGFTLLGSCEESAELIICIGGDGAFLEAIHKFGFPKIPFIGINTGHLGFFQEIHPDKLDEFIADYKAGKYEQQHLATLKAEICFRDGSVVRQRALNEFIVKSTDSHAIHLNLSIGGSFIECFSGDGILISTPAGSTAYNYSLGGSIADPRISLLQVTPIAPMNTTAFRSFTSSILLPPDIETEVVPEENEMPIRIAGDGIETDCREVSEIRVSLDKRYVNLLRFEGYDFWNKVKTKFL